MRGVRSNVLKSQRASSSNDEDLEHEVVECFKKDLAEAFGLHRRAIVVAERGCARIESIWRYAILQISLKIVSDAFETYIQREKIRLALKVKKSSAGSLRKLTPEILKTDDFFVVRSALVLLHQFNEFRLRYGSNTRELI